MSPRKSLILSLPFLFGTVSLAAPSCDYSSEGVRKAYDQILAHYPKPQAVPHFQCLLEIHKNSSGVLKILAGDALRPLMGGHALAGRGVEKNSKKMAQLLKKVALRSPDVIHDSFLQDYTDGAWGFYDLFCKPPVTEHCFVFLPDEKQIQTENDLFGSSSMMILRNAYLTLQGKDRELVADRIKNLYQKISQDDFLKRKIIDQIYQELFGHKAGFA
jgi:hypothetical protein